MKRYVKVMAITALLTAPVAQAQPGLYAGAGVSAFSYEEPGLAEVKPVTLDGVLGYQFNRYFAAESRLGFNVRDDEFRTAGGQQATAEVNYFASVYAKGIVPLMPRLSAYGLLGSTHARLEASVPAGSQKIEENDMSFGVGASYQIKPGLALGAEWLRMLDESDAEFNGELDAWRLGLQLRL